MSQIEGTDHPWRSVQAIYRMWKAKINPATFPAIPGDLPMSQFQDHLTKWLFDTGYLNPQYYRSTYEQCEEITEEKARAMLDEIFCNTEAST